MLISRTARVWLAVVSCLLLIPTLGTYWQATGALEQFHNRSLAAWPAASSFLPDPSAWFAQSRRWLADRIYPIIAVSYFQKRFLVEVLDTPPQRRITLGAGGLVFLNGSDDAHLNNILDAVCVRAHQPERVAAIERSLSDLAAYGKATGLPIDVIIVPTLETLYGDSMPGSVPSRYRRACADVAAGRTPMTGLRAPASLHLLYPLAAMRDARGDVAFYPKGNWHPEGRSLTMVRNAYLADLGFGPPPGETLRRGAAPSELLLGYGIRSDRPVYQVINPDVVADSGVLAELRPAIADLFKSPYYAMNAYRDARAPDPDTVLMLSDSFGEGASLVFAGGFRRVIQITTNDLRDGRIAELLTRVSGVVPVTRLLLLVEEGDTDRIAGYGPDLLGYLGRSGG